MSKKIYAENVYLVLLKNTAKFSCGSLTSADGRKYRIKDIAVWSANISGITRI